MMTNDATQLPAATELMTMAVIEYSFLVGQPTLRTMDPSVTDEWRARGLEVITMRSMLASGWGFGVQYFLITDMPINVLTAERDAAESAAIREAFAQAKAAYPDVVWDGVQTAYPEPQPEWNEALKGRPLTASELAPWCSPELADDILSTANEYSFGVRVYEAQDCRYPLCPKCGAHNFKVPLIRVHNCKDRDNRLFLIDLDKDGLSMTEPVDYVEFNTRGVVFELQCRECGATAGLEIRYGHTDKTEFYWHSRDGGAGEGTARGTGGRREPPNADRSAEGGPRSEASERPF